MSYSSASAVLAPFWADAVTGSGNPDDGIVYYHAYTKWSISHMVDSNTDYIISLASSTIRQLTGKEYFSASDVLVVTWHEVSRYGGPSNEVSLICLMV